MNIVNVSTHNLKIRTHTEDGSYTFTLMAGEKIDLPPKDCKIMINNFHVDSPYDVGLKLKDARIAALEATLEKICYSHKINTVVCNDCHSYSETKEAIVHAPNCFFMQVQKELDMEEE